jgi:hypothetical protein
MASTGVETAPGTAAAPAVAGAPSEVRVYPHSLILYWWVVWAYGFFCALLTFAQGETFTIGGGKPLLIFPAPWLGVSFTLLLLFTVLATTVKARGIGSILLLLLLAAAAAGTQFVMSIEGLFKTPPAILVHMNLAFYMMVSSALFVVWVVIVFIFDRLSFWRFRGAQIERVQRFASIVGRAPESYSVMHVRLTRFSDDILDHKILGLGIVGLGTSDIEGRIAIFGGGNEVFRIENVWRATRSLRQIQAMMGAKATVVT